MFGKKKQQSNDEPVRQDQVKRLSNRMTEENDATLFDVDGCRDYPRAKAALDAAMRNSTDAEIRAAYRRS